MALSRPVVAAIPYRRRGDGVELLLVRTRGGAKWTFPKGHVEKGETPPVAAAREAREEAGTSGRIREAPLAHYRYAGKAGAHEVAAYLLEVQREETPGEKARTPTWFSPAEARRKLAEGGREPGYAREHERVVQAALRALQRKRRA